MPSVPVHPSSRVRHNGDAAIATNPLPRLLQTPGGLALLEIQGTLHTPSQDPSSESSTIQTPVGRLVFLSYNPNSPDPENLSWMKRVYLYVGKHQRMTGEVKKLPKPIAILCKSRMGPVDAMEVDGGVAVHKKDETQTEELEIVEIVKYKILFASRPEPVGD